MQLRNEDKFYIKISKNKIKGDTKSESSLKTMDGETTKN